MDEPIFRLSRDEQQLDADIWPRRIMVHERNVGRRSATSE